MNIHIFRTLVLGLLLPFSLSAKAEEKKCMGPAYSHSIVFASEGASDGSLTIRRSIDGVAKEDILDDTGYVSANILVVSLVTADKNPSIRTSEKSDSLRLLQMRLKKLKYTLLGAGLAEDAKSLKAIDRVLGGLNSSEISKQDLKESWENLNSALYSERIKISARTKQTGTSEWSSGEVPLKDFAMPSYAVIRGLSCVDSVGSLQLGDAINASISKVAEPTASYTADKASSQQKAGGTK